MKMVNDTDMFYNSIHPVYGESAWMKAERLEYCEKAAVSTDKTLLGLFKTIFEKR